MKLHLPKGLRVALMAVMALSAVQQASAEWAPNDSRRNNTFFVKDNGTDWSSHEEGNYVLDTTIWSNNDTDTYNISPDSSAYAGITINQMITANGKTLAFNCNPWHDNDANYAWRTLLIEKLSYGDAGNSGSLVVADKNAVTVSSVVGSLNTVTSNGTLNLNAAVTVNGAISGTGTLNIGGAVVAKNDVNVSALSLSEGGSLTVDGGTLYLSGTLKQSGVSFVNGGVLQLGAALSSFENTIEEPANGYANTTFFISRGVGMEGLSVLKDQSGNELTFSQQDGSVVYSAFDTTTYHIVTGTTNYADIVDGEHGAETTTISMDGGTLSVAGGGTVSQSVVVTADSVMSSTGTVTVSGVLSGTKTMTLEGSGSNWIFNQMNGFEGSIVVKSGAQMSIANGTAPSALDSITLEGSGSKLQLEYGAGLGSSSHSVTINMGEGSQLLQRNGAGANTNTYANIHINGTATIAGSIYGNNTNLRGTIDGTGTLALTGVTGGNNQWHLYSSVSGALAVELTGGNEQQMVYFSGDNSYTGGTTINRGKLVVDHANALGSTGDIKVKNGGCLELSLRPGEIAKYASRVTSEGNGYVFLGTNKEISNDGDYSLNATYTAGGTLNFNGKGYASDTTKTLTIAEGGSLTVANTLSLVSKQALVVNGGTLTARGVTLGHNDASAAGHSDLFGSLSLAAGSVTLSGQIGYGNSSHASSAVSVSGGTFTYTGEGNLFADSVEGKTLAVSLTGGTVKATENSWTLNHDVTLGSVTFEAAEGKTITLDGAITQTAAITNNGGLVIKSGTNIEASGLSVSGGTDTHLTGEGQGFTVTEGAEITVVNNAQNATLTAENVTVTQGGTTYTLNAATGKAQAESSTDYSTYHIQSGDATYADIQTAAGEHSSDLAAISMESNTDTTLTVAGATVSESIGKSEDAQGKLKVVASGETSFTGRLQADTLELAENARVTVDNSVATLSLDSTSNFAVDALTLNTGSTLSITGAVDLDTVSITLSDDYKTSIAQTLAGGTEKVDLITSTGTMTGNVTAADLGLTDLLVKMENNVLFVTTQVTPPGPTDKLTFTLTGASLAENMLTLTGTLVEGTLKDDSVVVVEIGDFDWESFLEDKGADPDAYVNVTLATPDGATLVGDPTKQNVIFMHNGSAYAGVAGQGYKLGSVPEPTTSVLSLLALAGLAGRRRRR